MILNMSTRCGICAHLIDAYLVCGTQTISLRHGLCELYQKIFSLRCLDSARTTPGENRIALSRDPLMSRAMVGQRGEDK